MGTTTHVLCYVQCKTKGGVHESQVKYGSSQIHGVNKKHYLVVFWSHALKCSVKGINMVAEEKPAMAGLWSSSRPLYNHRQFNLRSHSSEQSCCTHLHLSCKLTYLTHRIYQKPKTKIVCH